MVFEVTLSSSAWPPSSMLVTPLRTSGGTSGESLSRRCNSARLESNVPIAAWVSPPFDGANIAPLRAVM